MPRKSRIYAPEACHHIIVRAIARQKIFFDDADRRNFVDRVDGIPTGTDTESDKEYSNCMRSALMVSIKVIFLFLVSQRTRF